MKIIGISGYSNSGKTTLANLIESYEDDIAQINLDYVFDYIKRKLFGSDIVKMVPNGDEPLLCLKDNPFYRKSNSKIHDFYLNLRSGAINFLVAKRLFALKRQGYSCAVVEGVTLESLFIKFDYLVRIDSDMKTRIERKYERDGEYCPAELIETWDNGDDKVNRNRVLPYNKHIHNTTDLISLDREAYGIYDNVFMLDKGKHRKKTFKLPFTKSDNYK